MTGLEAGFLSDKERLRLAGFRFEKRRSDWLSGRWTAKHLLRKSLPWLANQELDTFQIENEDSGQPYLVGPDGQRMEGCLSISHREGKAFCALAVQAGAHLGADLEKVERRDPIFLEDYLGPNERRLALSCEGSRRDFLVTLAWSVKEAAFKALGTGLRMDTRQIEITQGMEEWAAGGDVFQGWQKFEIGGPGLPGPAHSFWQQKGDFVLTLVVLGREAPVLFEV